MNERPYNLKYSQGEYVIVENATSLVMYSSPDEEDVRAYYRFLKRGGSFYGWTPQFMMTKIDVSKFC